MSGSLSENFEIYGGDVTKLLQGRANQIGSDFGVGLPATVLQVPAFETQGRFYLAMLGRGARIRRSLPGAGVAGYGMYAQVYMDALPSRDDDVWPIILWDAGNNIIAKVAVRPNGNLQVRNSANTVVAESAGPVVKAGTLHKIGVQVAMSGGAGTAIVQVDGVQAINATALTLAGTIAQAGVGNNDSAFYTSANMWCKFFASWTTTGTYNTNFPAITGVQRLTARGDGALTGFTPRPRQKIGAGVLGLLAGVSVLDASAVANFDLGSGDYTLETFVRSDTLPTGVNSATLLGRWSQPINKRSYRLVKYGPGVNGGNLRFEISTDGTLAGVITLADIVWAPEIGTWYNLAVSRTAGVTRVFINGVQQGANIADANTYFAVTNTAKFTLGGEFTGNNVTPNANTNMDGFLDESRITVGVGRYTANFTPTVVAFPRSIGGGDASFASVQLLIGCDNALVDESTTAPKTIAAIGANAGRYVPADGGAQYLTINSDPLDDRFLESSLIAATNVLTFTGQPANNETAVLGATTYTWKTVLTGAANEVLIDTTAILSIQNLMNAINAGPGIGTKYGTGTVINASAGGTIAPTTLQLTATAYTPGAAGNAIVTTETIANASWNGATLSGGSDIPGPSEFPLTPLDPRTTGIRWLDIVDRSFVSIGAATMKKTLNVSGNTVDGATNALTPTPTYYQDIVEQDPHTAAAVTPTTVLNGSIRLTRVS